MITPAAARHAAEKPSHARYKVVAFAITLAILAYIDRVCISMAAPNIMRDLNLSKEEMSYIFAAFAIAYAAFEIPGGWMGDWMGARKVLMRIVIWWSIFTALTGAMWNFWSMWVTRFLFGAGEAGCFPSLTKAFSSWLPTIERTRMQGVMWMAARWGGAFTPPLVILTFQLMSWRWAFVLYGLLGIIWAVFFYRWFRDNPKDHPAVNAGEMALLEENQKNAQKHVKVPWGKVVQSPTVWLLWVQYFLLTYPWYFYITWLPTYLQEARGLTPNESARLSILPLFFGGFGCMFAGFVAAKLIRVTGSTATARRILACTGFAGAAVMLVLSIRSADATTAMIFMGLASFCNDLVMPGAWATCMDVGGKFAGTIAGSMNMMGNIAGFIAPVVGAQILKHYGGDWNIFLYTMAGAYLLGTLVWPFIQPTKPLPGSE